MAVGFEAHTVENVAGVIRRANLPTPWPTGGPETFGTGVISS